MHTALQPFQTFLDKAVQILQQDPEAIGIAVGGSWASSEMDAYSDLDLVVVTAQPIAPDLESMRAFAGRFGTMLTSFRGDHVGEPRLLITLYDEPLLHVDIKFLTTPEFYQRVENPVIVWERGALLSSIVGQTTAQYPPFDFQWIEDRFWVWMHYALLKIGRGEYFEALDFLAFVRSMVLGPMLHLKNNGLPRGVRHIERVASADDLATLQQTVATPSFSPLMDSLSVVMNLYSTLVDSLAPATLEKRDQARRAVQGYYDQIASTNRL